MCGKIWRSLIMKKFALLLALGLLVEPAFSATYYYKATNTRPAIPYTSTTYNFMPRRYSYVDFNKTPRIHPPIALLSEAPRNNPATPHKIDTTVLNLFIFALH